MEFVTFSFLAKIAILILIGLYIVFGIILLNKVKSLEKLVIFTQTAAPRIITIIALLHLLFAISLFVIALAIL